LKVAFGRGYIEGQTKTYRLQDTTASTANFLVQWLYSSTIEIRQHEEIATMTIGEIEAEDEGLVEFWVLAEKLRIPALQNYAVTEIQRAYMQNKFVAEPAVNYVWNNTTSESPLRQLMIDQCFRSLEVASLVTNADEFPHAMLAELLIKTWGEDTIEEHRERMEANGLKTTDYQVLEN
jgi:hypothetical protein